MRYRYTIHIKLGHGVKGDLYRLDMTQRCSFWEKDEQCEECEVIP